MRCPRFVHVVAPAPLVAPATTGVAAFARFIVTIVIGGVLMHLPACLPTIPPSSSAPRAFADDFEHAGVDGALLPPWRASGGSFRVVPGEEGHVLATVGDHNLPLWLDVPLARNTRIEFTSRALSSAIDMKMEVFGDGQTHQSGYVVIVGGWNNSLSVIARLDEHERHRVEKRTRWDSNRTYRWRVERSDGHTLQLFVDDVLLLSYDDPRPLVGPRHDRMGFSAWESSVQFDNLVVTPLAD